MSLLSSHLTAMRPLLKQLQVDGYRIPGRNRCVKLYVNFEEADVGWRSVIVRWLYLLFVFLEAQGPGFSVHAYLGGGDLSHL